MSRRLKLVNTFSKKCYIVYGVNGSGKTTLFTSIFTLTPFFKEDVLINGIEARKYNKKEQRNIRDQQQKKDRFTCSRHKLFTT